jgi:hypothetical protein
LDCAAAAFGAVDAELELAARNTKSQAAGQCGFTQARPSKTPSIQCRGAGRTRGAESPNRKDHRETVGNVQFSGAALAVDCSSQLALRAGNQLESAGKAEQYRQ